MTQRRSQRRRRFSRPGRRGFFAAAALAAGLLLVASLMPGIAGPGTTTADPGSSVSTPTPTPPLLLESREPEVLNRSEPESIAVPAIGVKSSLETLPEVPDKGTITLPSKPGRPGWFDQSATPGERGITTIIGYIAKTSKQPGVFHKIGKLEVGDTIVVTRADGREVEFIVRSIDFYPEGEFPSEEVYIQSDRPELRLITCGGTIDPKDPPGNVVVSASTSTV